MIEYVVEGRSPKWIRTAFADEESHDIFIPIALCTDETLGLMCMGFDGIKFINHKGHIYAPIAWMKKEYRSKLVDLQLIESKINNWLTVSNPPVTDTTDDKNQGGA